MSIVVDPDTGEIIEGGKTLEQRTSSLDTPIKVNDRREQLTLDVGGEEPTASLMKFSGSIPLDGEYDKGAMVRFVVTGRIVGVGVKDIEDKHGQVVGTERIHTVKLQGGGPAE